MRYLNIPTAKKISKIGLGTWQFGSSAWGYGAEYAGSEARAIVRRALEVGTTLFDTAEVYGLGRSERILGHRLGARRIDLYQVHQPNPAVRDGTTMRGMRALQRIGLVGEVGVSNYPLRRWQAAEAALGGRVLSNQVRYSLVARAPERELLPFAEANNRVIIAYSPLAQGLLAGGFHQGRRPANRVRITNPLFLPENLDRAAGLTAALREVAEAHSATPAQIALAWVLRHPAVVAIPGASSVAQLESNAAAEIDLTDAEHAALREAAERFEPVRGPAVVPGLIRSRMRGRQPGSRQPA